MSPVLRHFQFHSLFQFLGGERLDHSFYALILHDLHRRRGFNQSASDQFPAANMNDAVSAAADSPVINELAVRRDPDRPSATSSAFRRLTEQNTVIHDGSSSPQ